MPASILRTAIEADGKSMTIDYDPHLQKAGKTCVLIGERHEKTTRVLGGLGRADVLRAEAPAVLQALKEIGIERIVMVTGDNGRVASVASHFYPSYSN